MKLTLQKSYKASSSHKRVTTPIKYDKTYFNDLHDTKGPEILEEQHTLEENMGFKFRKGIGELSFAAIICRPEIMYAAIKLSQFSTQPAEIHYQSVKYIFKHLRDTITFGIHYWRPEPRLDCPLLPFPDLAINNHDMSSITKSPITEHYGYVDSD